MITNKNEKNNGGNVNVSSSSNQSGSSNIASGKGESTQGAYIPPHRRQQLFEENKKQSNRVNDGPRNSKWKDEPSHQGGQRRQGGFFDEKPRHYNNNNNRKPSKFRDDSGFFGGPKRQEYGSDGLLPQDKKLEEELFGNRTNTGIDFDKYSEIPVEAYGTDVPACIGKFSDIPIGPVLENAINLLKYDVPTPVQQHALPIIYAKRDLMACAQTGSGKTAAFLFPTIAALLEETDVVSRIEQNMQRKTRVYPRSLILAPTRELASQIHKEARKLTYRSHLRSVVVYGGADSYNQIRELKSGCDILVATPGRLTDMIERGYISLEDIRYLCLDEADRMLDMGFEKQIRFIVTESNMPDIDKRQTLMFSATFPKPIQRLAAEFLKDYVFLKVGKLGSTTDFITQQIKFVEDENKKEELLYTIDSVEGLTLVFVETKKSADYLEEFLARKGYPSSSIHGDKSQSEREAALESFKSGYTPILVATDVAARGLDISNVAHVINFDMPDDISNYVHRIGRTGRAGNTGIATAFFNENNRNVVKSLIEILEQAAQEVPSFLIKLNSEYSSNRGGRNNKSNYRGRGRGGYSNGYSNGYYDRGSSGPSDYRYERDSHRDSNSYGGYGYGYNNGYGGSYGS